MLSTIIPQAQTRPILSFHEINKEIGNMVPSGQAAESFTEFVDEYGTFHRFYSPRDYLIYLDEKDLELIGKKS